MEANLVEEQSEVSGSAEMCISFPTCVDPPFYVKIILFILVIHGRRLSFAMMFMPLILIQVTMLSVRPPSRRPVTTRTA